MDADQFHERLCKVAFDALKECTDTLRQEQAENARLRRIIADYPQTCWELQERISLLETAALAEREE